MIPSRLEFHLLESEQGLGTLDIQIPEFTL